MTTSELILGYASEKTGIGIIVFFFHIVLLATPSYSVTEFTKTVNLCPINTSYNEFSHILKEMQAITAKANSDFKSEYSSEEISLGNRYEHRTIKSEINESLLNQGPEIANEVYYRYVNSDAPISNIDLRLGDYERVLNVSGFDESQVNALAALVDSKFKKLGCALGGGSFRSKAGTVLFLFGLVIFTVFVLIFIRKLRIYIFTAIVFSFIWPTILMILPWSSWFPGTAIRAGAVTFYAQHEGLLYGFSIVFALILFLIGLVIRRK